MQCDVTLGSGHLDGREAFSRVAGKEKGDRRSDSGEAERETKRQTGWRCPVSPKQDLATGGKGRTIVRYNFAGSRQLWVWETGVPISQANISLAGSGTGRGAMW
jgi:hypothetical protein